MATTTNYSWTTPDDTALVKDGASAIRTLGTSIDTTTKNLNPSTTLGDIEYRSSSANTNTRLGIGSTGQVLTVSGGVPAWATPSSGGMTLLSTTSLSGTTTTVSSIDQTYTNLIVFITGVTFSANANLRIKLNATGLNQASISGVVGGTATTRSNIEPEVGGYTADVDSTHTLLIYNYTQTSQTLTNVLFYGNHRGPNSSFVYGGAGYNGASASAITSIQITTAAGTSTFTAGTVKIYGVK